MRLSRALVDKKLDLRLRDKLVADGKVPQKDIDQYLNALNDDAENCTIAGSEGADLSEEE